MKELTKAEEQVMQYLWQLEKGFLKDIVAAFDEPRPAYTTVATVVKVLVEKGFVAFNSYGNLREYYPAVTKTDYSKRFLRSWTQRFFEGSRTTLLSYFVKDKDLNLNELEELRRLVDEQIERKKEKPDNN